MNDTMSPDQTTPSPTVAHPTATTAQLSPQASQSAWNPAEVVALLSLAAVSIAASSWSAIALHGVAQMSGITSWLAWGAPVIVDGPIVQAAFALVTLNRRERAGVVIPKATRWFFWGELAAAELVSLIGNGVHAWNSDGLQLSQMAAAAVAGAAPVAALATTHALTALMEVPRTPQTQATPPVAPATAGDNQATTPEIGATAPDSEATTGVADATAERDAEIWRLHREGLSYREIATVVALHHGTVGKIIGRLKAESDTAAPQLALPAPNNVRSIAG